MSDFQLIKGLLREQEHVLRELDALNDRVEAVLREINAANAAAEQSDNQDALDHSGPGDEHVEGAASDESMGNQQPDQGRSQTQAA